VGEIRWLIDAYLDWLGREGVPVVEDVAVDLLSVETKPWARMGANGAFVHTHSRGDLCSLYLVDVPPGGATAPQRHLYEEAMFVLDGQGSTVVERPNGERRSFEWGRGSLWSLPLNTTYRLFNTSGQRRARIASVTNLPMVMKQFRNEDFVFRTAFDFAERWGEERYYRGDGTFIATREMRNLWEANFIPDTLGFDKLTDSPSRGKGSKNIQFILGETTMAAHISEVGVGSYKMAHIHGDGTHIIQLGDEGSSLYWREGDPDFRRVDWRFGMLHSPGNDEWHQHFNVSDRPGRYLPMSYGGYRFPFTNAQRRNIQHDYRKKSAIQIEYGDEDPRIRALFEEERAKYIERRRSGKVTA
jgi:mannose-6-phosphate isomerase-like protein (cupin superfamily)